MKGVDFLFNIFSKAWDLLITSYSVPGYVWFFIIIFVIIGIVGLYSEFKPKKKEEDFLKYTKDTIYGIPYRWKWNQSEIYNLDSFCPKCDGILVSNYDVFYIQSKSKINCENCDFQLIQEKYYSSDLIKREISRRIRTGEYKK